jgi:hypothetical protein
MSRRAECPSGRVVAQRNPEGALHRTSNPAALYEDAQLYARLAERAERRGDLPTAAFFYDAARAYCNPLWYEHERAQYAAAHERCRTPRGVA